MADVEVAIDLTSSKVVAQCGSVLGLRAAKWTVSLVLAWFRADSGTNLFKQGEIVTG